MPVVPLDPRRFNALAGYTRAPGTITVVQEFDWLATDDERVLGVLIWDRYDRDFGWVALGRDERMQFRGVDFGHSMPTAEAARAALTAALTRLAEGPPEDLLQLEDGPSPVDFFAPITPVAEQNPLFRTLVEDPRYSPARELIAAMMRYHQDVDGNFIQQFQTVGFDTRLWELYLYAVFTECGFARDTDAVVPDFLLTGPRGRFGVEATTANPAQGGGEPAPMDRDYVENFIPIKLARRLKRKLRKDPSYWTAPGMEGLPFVLAIQDFHAPGAMRMIAPAAAEYLFGVRHSMVDGAKRIERIERHVHGALQERSGFFQFDGAENVSAVIVNPQGTLLKFNRLGYIAGFGDRRVRMVRESYRRHDDDPENPMPRRVVERVDSPDYEESWMEGMIVLHNPRAMSPLHPDLLPDATHEFLQPDGRIMSRLPPRPPVYFSQTAVFLDGEATPPAEDG